ncbi:MAG: hypothetical protein QOJ42_4513 [Acidobacteriaceae bacterium]|nr:hypothetical protein [Acidobacteriaceae bacterium]
MLVLRATALFKEPCARLRFAGPITIGIRYETKDEINPLRHDLDFVRKGSRGIRRQVAS